MLRSLEPGERKECLSAIVPRFSVVAGLSVIVLVATGIFSTWAQVTVVPAVETPYGVTLLLVKLAIVGGHSGPSRAEFGVGAPASVPQRWDGTAG